MGTIVLGIVDGIATLTLDYPERRNALSTDLLAKTLDALEETRSLAARAVVVTGSPPAFCAGANVDDLLTRGWMESDPSGPTPYDLFAAIESDPRPVIAAVNGAALGGGFELCLCCDLVLASDAATFAFPELGLGVIPNTALGRLSGIVGRRTAAELILTRRPLTAAEAADLSLVNEVCRGEDLLSTAVERARRIVHEAPPSAIAAAKSLLRGPAPMSWPEIRRAVAAVRREEWTEGLCAFKERRRADFDQFWEESTQEGSTSSHGPDIGPQPIE
jgi:enoyl-CoA hydratase/carnithine racemase